MNPPKSAHEHWLTGTTRKGREHTYAPDDPAYTPGRPRFPKGCSGETRKAFKRLCRLLEQRRHLTEGDGELLRLYAIIFDRHERALHKLDEEGEFVTAQQFGKGGIVIEVEKVNPALKVAEVCEKNLCAILDRLGLTPVNRKAVKAKSTADEPEVDPLTELMNSRRGTFIAPPASDDRLANEHTDFDS